MTERHPFGARMITRKLTDDKRSTKMMPTVTREMP